MVAMKLTKRNQLGYASLDDVNEKTPTSFLVAVGSIFDKKDKMPSLIKQNKDLLSKYNWSGCPDEEVAELNRIFESVPDDLQIFFECWPNGSVALDSRAPITSANQEKHLQQWLQTLEQHLRIHNIKMEMEREKKEVGYWRWTWWTCCDRVMSTRRAEERIGKRVEKRMIAEGRKET